MPIWDSMGRVVVYKGSDEAASNKAEYLIKQGISAVVYHDPDDAAFSVTVPAADEGHARTVLASHGRSSLFTYLSNLNHAPKRASKTHVENDSSRFPLIFLICGGIVFLIALAEFIVNPFHGSPIIISVVELILGALFIVFGICQLIRSRRLEHERKRESAFTETVVRWMASTYSGDDIDSIILRGASFEELENLEDLETSRRAIIKNYIVREFDVQPDEAYIFYLTSQSYSAIYEIHAIK